MRLMKGFCSSAMRTRVSRRQKREGATAVEFAMVVFPFLFLLFAILEIGVIVTVNLVLENAVQDASRLVRTGQVAGQKMDANQFKTFVCGHMGPFKGDCAARTSIDVRDIPQFRTTPPPDPMSDGERFDDTKLEYLPGQPGSLMLVRVWYRQPIITPFLGQALSRLKDGQTVLMATSAFRNEPYNQ